MENGKLFNRPQSLIVVLALVTVGSVAFVWASASRPAQSSPPRWINYQGRLTTPLGLAVNDGQYNAVFRLFDAPTTGTQLWSESGQVTAIDGVFNTSLGQSSAFPSDLFTQRLWLESEIDGRTLTPRQELGAVAFAMTALSLPDNTVSSSMLQDSAVTTNKIADRAVTEPKLADGSVSNTKIQDFAVTGDKIAPLSIGSGHILPGAIGFEQLGNLLHATQTARPYKVLANVGPTDLGDEVFLDMPGPGAVLITAHVTFRSPGEVFWAGIRPVAILGQTRILATDRIYGGTGDYGGTNYWSISSSTILDLPSAGRWTLVIETHKSTTTDPVTAHTYAISAVYLGASS